MTNFERYNKLHGNVINRLENGEITMEMAKNLNDAFFDKYIVNSTEVALELPEGYNILESAVNDMSLQIAEAYYTESEDSDNEENKNFFKKVIDAIKEFFDKCRQFIKDTVKKFKEKSYEEFTSEKLREAMDNFQTLVEDAEKHGKKSIKFFDIEKAYQCFGDETEEYIDVLRSLSWHNIADHKYILRVEDALDKTDAIRKKYDEKLHEIVRTKKEYSIRDAKYLYIQIEQERAAKFNGLTTTLGEYEELYNSLEREIIEAIKKFEEEMEGLTPAQRERRDKALECARKVQARALKVSEWCENHARLIFGACVAGVIALPVVTMIIDAN